MYSVPEFNSERFSRESDIKRPDKGNQKRGWKSSTQGMESPEAESGTIGIVRSEKK